MQAFRRRASRLETPPESGFLGTEGDHWIVMGGIGLRLSGLFEPPIDVIMNMNCSVAVSLVRIVLEGGVQN